MSAMLAEFLEAARESLASVSGAEVHLGAPDGSAPGLYLFPYKVAEDHVKRATARFPADPATAATGLVISCLLMSDPPGDFQATGAALDGLMNHPLIDAGSHRITVSPDDLAVGELTAIFSSAGVSLRLAVALTLRGPAAG